jgi:hypothetical protein
MRVSASSPSSDASSSDDYSSQEESSGSEDDRSSYSDDSSTCSVEANSHATAGSLIRLPFSMTPEADLRAVPVRVLLADFGHVWSSSSPSTKQVPSTPCWRQQWFLTPEYDAFVSHNWGAGRLEKHLALLLAFNGRAALVIGILCGPLVGFFEVFFHFPFVTGWYDRLNVNGRESDIRFRWWAEIVGFIVFMVVIWCWHLTEGVCWRRKALFLDKLCIDQEDAHMKQMGIKSLPAYLNHTRMLLIIWSEAYLSRLWCVLELATWVYLEKANIVFLPVMTANILCGYFFYMQWTGLMNSVYAYYKLTTEVWQFLSFWLPIFAACAIAQVVIQRLMRSRLALDKQLKSFDCRKAQCTDDRDREMILEQIQNWFGQAASTVAETQGNSDEAEAAHMLFNKVVRTTVYERLHRISGNAARLRYEWVLLACLPHWWRWCDITASAAEGHLPIEDIVNIVLHGFCMTFCYAPLLLQAFLWITAWTASSKVFGRCGGFPRGVCISVVSLVTCSLFYASEVVANRILSVESWSITISADATLLLITVATYSSRMRWRTRRWLLGDRSHCDDFVD